MRLLPGRSLVVVTQVSFLYLSSTLVDVTPHEGPGSPSTHHLLSLADFIGYYHHHLSLLKPIYCGAHASWHFSLGACLGAKWIGARTRATYVCPPHPHVPPITNLPLAVTPRAHPVRVFQQSSGRIAQRYGPGRNYIPGCISMQEGIGPRRPGVELGQQEAITHNARHRAKTRVSDAIGAWSYHT